MSVIDEQVRAAEEEFLELFVRGPADGRWSELPPQVGDAAPDFRLLDANGEERSLSELWRERPASVLRGLPEPAGAHDGDPSRFRLTGTRGASGTRRPASMRAFGPPDLRVGAQAKREDRCAELEAQAHA